MRLVRLGLAPVLGLLPLLGFGCSDPVPPTPRAAFFAQWVDDGAACSIQSHNIAMGQVDSRKRDLLKVDGEGGASVECKVSGAGSFSISASASDTTNNVALLLVANGVTAQATEEAPALGSVSVASTTTGGESGVSDSSDPCQLWFIPDSGEGIAPGKVWVAFKCPKMLINMTTCRVAQGYAIFENCET